jgi:hypothetical protein
MASNFRRSEEEEVALVPGAAGLAGQLSDRIPLKEVGLYGLYTGLRVPINFFKKYHRLNYERASAIFAFCLSEFRRRRLYRSKRLIQFI